jgi:hypothetical protein
MRVLSLWKDFPCFNVNEPRSSPEPVEGRKLPKQHASERALELRSKIAGRFP